MEIILFKVSVTRPFAPGGGTGGHKPEGFGGYSPDGGTVLAPSTRPKV